MSNVEKEKIKVLISLFHRISFWNLKETYEEKIRNQFSEIGNHEFKWSSLYPHFRVCKTNLPFELFGKTIGIFGLGSIGEEIAKKAKSFGMRVLGIKRNINVSEIEGVDEVFSISDISEVLGRSDFFVYAKH